MTKLRSQNILICSNNYLKPFEIVELDYLDFKVRNQTHFCFEPLCTCKGIEVDQERVIFLYTKGREQSFNFNVAILEKETIKVFT